MPYMDIWIYNSRPRMRVFLCYLLIFIAFFIFSDIMIYLYTKSLCNPIEDYQIHVVSPQVTVSKTEVSNVSGNIIGNIKNNTNEIITNKYLKFDFYTPRGVQSGVKYLKIDSLNINEEKTYELGFKYNNVNSVQISMVEEEQVKNATPEELEISPVIGTVGIFGGILFSFL